jgi:hypothetical protein
MKKALLLSGLLLCASGLYAENTRANTVADGRKRNEEAYERMLEQTGWKNEKTSRLDKNAQPAPQNQTGTSPSKSS